MYVFMALEFSLQRNVYQVRVTLDSLGSKRHAKLPVTVEAAFWARVPYGPVCVRLCSAIAPHGRLQDTVD